MPAKCGAAATAARRRKLGLGRPAAVATAGRALKPATVPATTATARPRWSRRRPVSARRATVGMWVVAPVRGDTIRSLLARAHPGAHESYSPPSGCSTQPCSILDGISRGRPHDEHRSSDRPASFRRPASGTATREVAGASANGPPPGGVSLRALGESTLTSNEVAALLALVASAPLALNFHPDRLAGDGRTVAQAMLDDGVYRSQFEIEDLQRRSHRLSRRRP